MSTSAILDTFLTTVGTDGLGCLSMAGNRLPVIPERLIESEFHQLECIYLQFNNIRTLKNGSFNFITKLDHLSLEGNQLNHIEPGAFQGTIIDHQFQIYKFIILDIFSFIGNYGNESVINLSRNNLTRFESAVFRTVLESLAPHEYSYIQMDNSI